MWLSVVVVEDTRSDHPPLHSITPPSTPLHSSLHRSTLAPLPCQRVLEKGSSLYICTGGEAESLSTTNGVDAVVLEGRQGFVRLALSYGTPLVPVYGHGNIELYRTAQPFKEFRRMLSKRFHVAIPLFWGRYFSPLPFANPVKVVIGAPIVVPVPKVKGGKVSPELVDEYHQK